MLPQRRAGRLRPVLLSDRDILTEIDAGRIALDPWDPAMMQPSSIDVRLDRFFRVFENHRYPHIDPAADQSDLTRMVEPEGEEPFILHPGEFVLGSTYEVRHAARRRRRAGRGQVLARPAGPADPRDRRLRRPRLLRPRHPRAGERRDAADQALPGHEDRPVLLLPALLAVRAPVRLGEVRLALPGPARPDAVAVLPELPPHLHLRSHPRRSVPPGDPALRRDKVRLPQSKPALPRGHHRCALLPRRTVLALAAALAALRRPRRLQHRLDRPTGRPRGRGPAQVDADAFPVTIEHAFGETDHRGGAAAGRHPRLVRPGRRARAGRGARRRHQAHLGRQRRRARSDWFDAALEEVGRRAAGPLRRRRRRPDRGGRQAARPT